MKTRHLLLLIAFTSSTVIAETSYSQTGHPLKTSYVFPLNASTDLPLTTSIIIRPGPALDAATVACSLLSVSASSSGNHSGTLQVSDDKKTLVFTPAIPFAYSDRVMVQLASGIRTSAGFVVGPISFSFTVQSKPAQGVTSALSMVSAENGSNILNSVTLPAPFPAVQVVNPFIDRPSPGAIILAPEYSAVPTSPDTSYLSIIDDSAHVLWQRPTLGHMQDFKLNTDGRYSYFDDRAAKFYAMDSTFTIVDSFQCPGYTTDFHDIELLPHDHALLLAFDTEKNVDMSKYIFGGNHQAVIVGAAVMEIDSLKKPIFIWRSRDSGGYRIGDMIDSTGLKGPRVDFVHANSIFKDTDGNIVLSARHLDEITKISYDGDTILWRFGGKHNQFSLTGDSIVGDALWFSHQHHVRRIANGNFTLFDNGNDHSYHDPTAGPYSRACEYQVDEQAKTAKLVWQFDEGKTDTSTSQGSVQRLPNGNTFISWGDNNYYSSFGPAMTEVRPDGSIAFEMSLASPYITYRAFRLPANTPGFTDAVSPSTNIPASLTLSIPYPNPCSGVSWITVDAPSRMEFDLRVYDALGHSIRCLASGFIAAGPHTFVFDAATLRNGVYHCVLRTNRGTIAREILVSK